MRERGTKEHFLYQLKRKLKDSPTDLKMLEWLENYILILEGELERETTLAEKELTNKKND